MTWSTLVLRYAAFAVLATLANLATQHAVLAGRPPVPLPVAMAAGTIVGLVIKYLLDKRWIFFDESRGLGVQSRKFGLYAVMGVVTTAIFWATELAFHAAFGSAAMRDVGAILGLAVGYAAKYALDRRFVFAEVTR